MFQAQSVTPDSGGQFEPQTRKTTESFDGMSEVS